MDQFIKKSLIFLAKFGIIFSVLQYILITERIQFFQEWLAETIGAMLKISVRNEVLSLGNYSLIVSPSCTGFVSAIILAAIVFSLKKPDLQIKVKIVLLSTIAFLIVNFFRVYLVVVTAKYFGFQYAELFHQFTWYVMSGIILAIWYFWMKKKVGIQNFGELI